MRTGTLNRIRKEGIVRVGFANVHPFAYNIDDQTGNGRLTGHAPEILRQVLEPLGVAELEGILTPFGMLIPRLLADRFDVIAAGMTVTPDRCRQVLFGDPEHTKAPGLVVGSGNPYRLKSYADLAGHQDLMVGAISDRDEAQYAIQAGLTVNRLLRARTSDELADFFASGRVQALALFDLEIPAILSKLKEYGAEMAQPFEDVTDLSGTTVREYGATAFRPGDMDFCEMYNASLHKMQASGRLSEVLRSFGMSNNNLPEGVRSRDLCS